MNTWDEGKKRKVYTSSGSTEKKSTKTQINRWDEWKKLKVNTHIGNEIDFLSVVVEVLAGGSGGSTRQTGWGFVAVEMGSRSNRSEGLKRSTVPRAGHSRCIECFR